ncbi:hypothetical protein CSW16_12440 [Thermus scotoductus]|nr:hypothetical protein CSW16_12440 [Thermus scotoductus]
MSRRSSGVLAKRRLKALSSLVRGVGAQVLAALRAFLVSMLHRQGVREKKAALEAFSFNPLSALRFLGLYAV